MTDSEKSCIIWLKSRASGGTNCVEVAFADESVLVRSSRDRLGPVLSFSQQEWMAFLEGATNGEFTPGEVGSDTV